MGFNDNNENDGMLKPMSRIESLGYLLRPSAGRCLIFAVVSLRVKVSFYTSRRLFQIRLQGCPQGGLVPTALVNTAPRDADTNHSNLRGGLSTFELALRLIICWHWRR